MSESKLIFTENAARKVKQIIDEEGDASLNLRAYIEGGGCSGFQYGFTLDSEIACEDTQVVTDVASKEGEPPASVRLLVDDISYPYLAGAEIDYQESMNGEQFVIRNPNAKTTCGCGSSFTVDEDKMEEGA